MNDNYFSSTFFKSPNWFWEWLDYILNRPSFEDTLDAWDELSLWFNKCSEPELQQFSEYFDGIIAPLPEPWNGLWIKDESADSYASETYCLSEDGQDDLNHWIICQGKTVWEKACAESLTRKKEIKAGVYTQEDDQLWAELIRLFNAKETIGTLANWEVYGEKITWVVRSYTLTLKDAEHAFYDRFGKRE